MLASLAQLHSAMSARWGGPELAPPLDQILDLLLVLQSALLNFNTDNLLFHLSGIFFLDTYTLTTQLEVPQIRNSAKFQQKHIFVWIKWRWLYICDTWGIFTVFLTFSACACPQHAMSGHAHSRSQCHDAASCNDITNEYWWCHVMMSSLCHRLSL